MFYGCTDLISLPDFYKMDLYGSEREIFCGCINLSYLPIDCEDFSYMEFREWRFFCCCTLKSLKGAERYIDELSECIDFYKCGILKNRKKK